MVHWVKRQFGDNAIFQGLASVCHWSWLVVMGTILFEQGSTKIKFYAFISLYWRISIATGCLYSMPLLYQSGSGPLCYSGSYLSTIQGLSMIPSCTTLSNSSIEKNRDMELPDPMCIYCLNNVSSCYTITLLPAQSLEKLPSSCNTCGISFKVKCLD